MPDTTGQRLEIPATQNLLQVLMSVVRKCSPRQRSSRSNNRFKEDSWYYWRMVTKNQFGETPGFSPAARFKVSSALPSASETLNKSAALGPGEN